MRLETDGCLAGNCDHVVQFYETTEDLAHTAGRYLDEALDRGGAVLIVATPEHAAALRAQIENRGGDPDRAEEEGRFISLDAATALSRFADGSRLDPDAFDQTIGAEVRRLGAAYTPLRAYGEMVGLLWEAGDVLGAIELERLWNRLAAQVDFDLLCGYPAALVSTPTDREALEEICRLHTSVLDSPALTVPPDARPEPEPVGLHACAREFPAARSSAAAARQFIADCLRDWGHGDELVIDDAQLVVSELATNAIVHAGSRFSVAVRCDGSAVRLAVNDRSRRPARMSPVEPIGVSGRGLRIVAAVTSAWGVEPTAEGKSVWAELGA